MAGKRRALPSTGKSDGQRCKRQVKGEKQQRGVEQPCHHETPAAISMPNSQRVQLAWFMRMLLRLSVSLIGTAEPTVCCCQIFVYCGQEHQSAGAGTTSPCSQGFARQPAERKNRRGRTLGKALMACRRYTQRCWRRTSACTNYLAWLGRFLAGRRGPTAQVP